MAAPQNVSLPPFFFMSDGMQIVVTALDAATGNTVAGVTVANVSVDVDSQTAAVAEDELPPPSPLLIPEDG